MQQVRKKSLQELIRLEVRLFFSVLQKASQPYREFGDQGPNFSVRVRYQIRIPLHQEFSRQPIHRPSRNHPVDIGRNLCGRGARLNRE